MPSDAADALEAIAAAANVLGFQPHVDALVLRPAGATFIYYLRDGEIRSVARHRHGPDVWTGGNGTDPGAVRKHVQAVDIDDIDTVDQRPFNRLVSGPFRDTSQFSDARLWALVWQFRDFERIATASSRTLECAPGIGETLAREVARTLSQYPLEETES